MEEILHQLIGSLSYYLQGFIHFRWCRMSAINRLGNHDDDDDDDDGKTPEIP